MVLTGLPLNIDIQQILLHLANFAVLFAGLYILLYKPVKDFMEKREAHYKAMDSEAQEKLALATAQADETAKRLSELDGEIDTMRREAANELNIMRVDAEKEAREKADKILDDAKTEAEQTKARIIGSAEKDINEMVSTAAEKIFVSENVNETYNAFLKKAKTERSVENAK